MSNPESGARRPLYLVTLTADEVDVLEAAIGRRVGAKLAPAPRVPRGAASKTSRPWRPSNPAPVAHQHLTPEAEAWLAKRHDAGFVPRPIATPAPSKPKAMTAAQREQARAFSSDAVKAWRALGHVVIVEPIETTGTLGNGRAGLVMVDRPATDWRNVRVLPLGVTA
jgi:hypothetical protein